MAKNPKNFAIFTILLLVSSSICSVPDKNSNDTKISTKALNSSNHFLKTFKSEQSLPDSESTKTSQVTPKHNQISQKSPLKTEVGKIPSIQLFFNVDAIDRLKTHMHPRIMELLGNIKPNTAKIPDQVMPFTGWGIKDFRVEDMRIQIINKMEDMSYELIPPNQIRVNMVNLSVEGTGQLKGTVMFLGDQNVDTALKLTGNGPKATLLASMTTQQPGDGLLPAIKIENVSADIADLTAELTDDQIVAQLFNLLVSAINNVLKSTIIEKVAPLLNDQNLKNEMEKAVNKDVIEKGIKIENAIHDSKFDLILTTRATGPAVVTAKGLHLPMDVRVYPPNVGYVLYTECTDPFPHLDMNYAFTDIVGVADRCIPYSFLRSMIDIKFKDEIKLPKNDFGLESINMNILPLPLGEDYMEFTPGMIKAKIRGTIRVNYTPFFEFQADANVNVKFEKKRPRMNLSQINPENSEKVEGVEDFGPNNLGAPPAMAEYDAILSCDNIYNIQNNSKWVPASLIEFITTILKDVIVNNNRIPIKVPGICIDYEKDDEFCIQNPELFMKEGFARLIADVSV